MSDAYFLKRLAEINVEQGRAPNTRFSSWNDEPPLLCRLCVKPRGHPCHRVRNWYNFHTYEAKTPLP